MKKSWFLIPPFLKNNLLYIILFFMIGYGIYLFYFARLRRAKEGMNTLNNQYTFIHGKTKIDFKINDMIQESLDILNCLKIDYLELVDASKVEMAKGYPDREYGILISGTELYKQVAKLEDASHQDLDDIWKKYFIANQLTPDIYTAFYKEMRTYSRDYYYVHRAINRDNSEDITEHTLVNYVMELMRKCRKNQSQLDIIKAWIIRLIQPIELHLKIVRKYADNRKTFHTKQDLQFIINKTADMIRTLHFEDMLHTPDKNIIHIFEEEAGKTATGNNIPEKEKPEWELKHPQYVTIDGITCYSIAIMLNNLYSAINDKIDFAKFKSKYAEYLTRESKPKSVAIDILAALMNSP